MIYPIRTIVAGIATLDARDPVLGAAVELGNRTGAVLHLVHAFELPPVVWDVSTRMGYVDGDALRHHMEHVQARLESNAHAKGSRARIRCHPVVGPVAPAIREVAVGKRADLIVVGATRRGALGRHLLGTTAQRVLRGAPAPVLVLRGALPAHLRRLLLTTDLSPFSAGIHELGLDVVETLFSGDEPMLRSVHAFMYDVDLPSLRPDLIRMTAGAELTAFLDQRRVRSRPVAGVVRFGDPAEEIVADAAEWQADLVVLGTHGRAGPKRWLLGSVAEAALRSTTASVLVIPAAVEAGRTLPVAREHSVDLVVAPSADRTDSRAIGTAG